MTTWVTSDQHYGHANIIEYCKRPFSNVDEMDATMILRHNEVVDKEDKVYIVGDFTLGDFKMFSKYYYQLNGIKFFIPGSHDWRWIESYSGWRDGIQHLCEPLLTIESGIDSRLPVVLCHYAMRVWDRSHYGSYHLYGHSHGNLPGIGRSMDIGVDTNNFYPYNLYEVLERLNRDNP